MNDIQSDNLTKDKFAWWTSFIGVVLVLGLTPVFSPSVIPVYKYVIPGIPTTLLVTLLGIVFASILGFLVGIGRVWNSILNRTLSIYVEVIRGIPLLVQIVYIYYVFGRLFHISRFVSAVVAITICYGAYMAEIVRSGLISINKGQVEAAQSLGMTKFQLYRYVIIPQAIRIILPPYGNEFIAMLKDSSLISIIAVADLMKKGSEYSAVHFNFFETFTIVALFYLLITLLFSQCVSQLEKLLMPKHKKKSSQKSERKT